MFPVAAPITILSKTTQFCVYPRPTRAAGVKREVPSHEEGHINYKPFFKKPVAQHTKPTKGTMNPLERYLARVEAIEAIAMTPCCPYHQKGGTEPDHSTPDPLEIETVNQELRRNGLAAISIQSSSYDDDDNPMFDVGEYNGTEYVTPDPALVRRIEWERFVMACGLAQRVYLSVSADGKPSIATDSARIDADTLRAYAPKFKAMLNGRSLSELLNDRERACFYGVVGSKMLNPAKRRHPGTTENYDDVNLGLNDPMCDIEEPHRTCATEGCRCHRCHKQHELGRPVELGLHDWTFDATKPDFEPTASELWPRGEDATTEANEAAMEALIAYA